MTIKKIWYSVIELAAKLNITTDELMHLGITGQLYMGFDRVLLQNLAETEKLPIKFEYAFKGQTGWENDRSFLKWAKGDDLNCPSDRFFPLNSNQLAILLKEKTLKISQVYEEDTELTLDIIITDNDFCYDFPEITIDDIIILDGSLRLYERSTLPNSNEISVENTIESPKKIANLKKIVGLLVSDLIARDEISLKTGENPNFTAMARKLEKYIPTDPHGDKDSVGLSESNIRRELKAGIDVIKN